jgi:hypothetical protein
MYDDNITSYEMDSYDEIHFAHVPSQPHTSLFPIHVIFTIGILALCYCGLVCVCLCYGSIVAAIRRYHCGDSMRADTASLDNDGKAAPTRMLTNYKV